MAVSPPSPLNNCGHALRLVVTFHATAAGSASGQVDVTDALRAQIISLSSAGESPAQDNLSPLALNFSGQPIGTTSAAQTVTLSNNVQGTLMGIRLQTNNPDYAFTTNCGGSLQQGSSCGIQVAFAPHVPGPDPGILAVIDADRTQQVQLNGAGTLANVTLTPGVLNFGPIGVQTSSATQTLMLTNGSTGTLAGISLIMQGPFTETGNCGASLAAGANCSISVVFFPNATGPQTGSLTVAGGNAATMTAQLTGTGISFELLPTSATSVTVKSGTAASYSLELMPVSGSAGNVAMTCGNVPPNSSCTVNPSTASLSGPTNIQVAIATGVGAAAQLRRAGVGAGSVRAFNPQGWAMGFAILLLPLWIRRRSRRIGAGNNSAGFANTTDRWMDRWMVVLLLVIMMAGVGACGKGGGPLGAGAQNPLPNNSLTPPGTYTVTVTAASRGLQKSVSLTVIAQ